ncbi:bifunctional riboflavin kinase/FAD synthetase [Hydrogenothermus marinus]|uniref:Riboflavin biosynthesis protein n=1 Tax=Hydrogenothermus marinus TaxID=133270 RepID=A0A3M0BIL8_9AQUI|nr:bifunctional riboflavin kinase/FAD synthetase [Hydrogenothermus marinus]RMA97283.1 riboflavin kinase/FMN adenylyltransferase [Hydrogenothermus marinus]
MKVLSINNLSINEDLACSVGNFDGFHKGHLKILNTLKDIAKEKNLKTAVITFDPHPRQVLQKKSLCKILNFETKKEFLTKIGIDYLIVIPFNKKIANLTKEDFLKLLKENLKCNIVVVGKDWRFGKNREGDINFAKEFGKKLQLEVIAMEEEKIKDKKISSSLIRELLREGKIKQVNKVLGRNYCLKGKVVEGKKLGRKIGFPTINLKVGENLCLKEGVYVGFIEIKDKIYNAIMNFGKRPTVDGKETVLEVHILNENFNENLKSGYLKTYFIDYLREEKKFNSLQELKRQIEKDVEKAKNILKEVKNEVLV